MLSGPIGDRFGYRAAVTSNTRGADYEYVDGSPLGEEKTLAFWGTLSFDPSEDLSLRLSSFIVDSEDTRALSAQIAPVAPGQCNRTFSGTLRQVGTGATVSSFTTDLSQSPLNLFCGTIPDWDAIPQLNPFVGVPNASTPLSPISAPAASVKVLPQEFRGRGMVSAPDGIGENYGVWRLHFAGDYELANGLTVSGFISHGESNSWSTVDSSYGTGAPRLAGFVRSVEDTSYELRVSSPGDQRLRYTLGINYYELDLIAGTYPAAVFGPVPLPNVNLQEGENLGIFGSLDYDLTDQFTLSLEGRWNEDTQLSVYEGESGGPPNAASNREQSFSVFMPRAILSWKPSDSINLYGSYSKSYLQGIPTLADRYATLFPAAGIDPTTVGFFTPRQELDAFEIGFKQRVSFLDYSVSVYSMDWKNQTFFDLSPFPLFIPINLAGDSEYLGLIWSSSPMCNPGSGSSVVFLMWMPS